jgi:EAL domain-containing protein (putative c-di-GMP-specific phosphodiesterase class I)
MAFHTQGIRLSIDDFGTGYSSLSRLKDMPISTLKIDRAFVKDLPGSIEEGRVTTAVIQLAENLGLTSLAEGIETEEQLTFLRDNGCRLGQGFLFSPAVPPDEIVVFYRGGPFAAKST